jgi:hypothetical protein
MSAYAAIALYIAVILLWLVPDRRMFRVLRNWPIGTPSRGSAAAAVQKARWHAVERLALKLVEQDVGQDA